MVIFNNTITVNFDNVHKMEVQENTVSFVSPTGFPITIVFAEKADANMAFREVNKALASGQKYLDLEHAMKVASPLPVGDNT